MGTKRLSSSLLLFCLATLALADSPMREPASVTKILWEVPLTRQSTNYSCGAAAMQSALAYYGTHLSEEAIMRAAGTTPQNGTEIEPMAALAEKYGVKAVARSRSTFCSARRTSTRS